MMKIKILGCSGGKNNIHGPTSFLLDEKILIDAGSVMDKLSIDEILTVDYLLLTHAHFDHIADLPFLAQVILENKENSFTLYASKEATDWVFSHVLNFKIWPDLFEVSKQNNGNLKWEVFNHLKVFEISNYKIVSIPVNHTVPTNGFIIDKGSASFAFTADTYLTDLFWESCNKKNNLKAIIIDVAFPNNFQEIAERTKHLTPKLLLEELKKLERNDIEIFITHIKPSCRNEVIDDLNRLSCELKINVLEEKMVIEV